MDKIANLIQALTNPADIGRLKTELQKQDSFLKEHVASLDRVLNELDPAIYSLGYLHLL